jgi:hypothetical protein
MRSISLNSSNANLMKTSDSLSTLFKENYPQIAADCIHLQFSYPQGYPQYKGSIHLWLFDFVLILGTIFQ